METIFVKGTSLPPFRLLFFVVAFLPPLVGGGSCLFTKKIVKFCSTFLPFQIRSEFMLQIFDEYSYCTMEKCCIYSNKLGVKEGEKWLFLTTYVHTYIHIHTYEGYVHPECGASGHYTTLLYPPPLPLESVKMHALTLLHILPIFTKNFSGRMRRTRSWSGWSSSPESSSCLWSSSSFSNFKWVTSGWEEEEHASVSRLSFLRFRPQLGLSFSNI